MPIDITPHYTILNLMNKDYLTAKEVASITGKTVYTVRDWIRKGILPAEKFPKTPKGHLYVKYEDIPTFLRK